MTALKQSIMRTIIYADCFEYALTTAQIHHYLISSQKYSSIMLENELHELVVSNLLLTQNGFYCLRGRNDLLLKRETTETISANKIALARKKTRLMTRLPWVEGIWITGNVAMSNAQDDDDIDLLIVTRDSWLWLTRLLILIVYGANGRLRLRRHSRRSVKNKLCLNMYLDTTVLEMPSHKKNVYTAHEVAQVMPLFNRNKVYERFLTANAWILKFLPHTQSSERGHNALNVTSTTSKPIRVLNHWLFMLQYHYMKNHLSRELVDEHRAFFHPRDTLALLTRKYTKRCNTMGISA